MTDLVVLSLEPWDDVWRRNQYLASGLLALEPALRILFVEPADDPLHDVRRGHRPRFGHRVSQIDERLWTFRPVKALPRKLDPRADDRLARGVERAASRLHMTTPALWVNDPRTARVAQLTGWPALYDMTDDWLAAERPEAELTRLRDGENWLLANAASVVACSPELVRRKADRRDGIVLVRNGVDAARYRQPAPRPVDLPDGPYALYVGTLHRDRIDVELVKQTARRLGGRGLLVLLGPEAWSAADAAGVRGAGAVVLGARSRDDVPGYLQHADVLVVPHVVSDFTDSLDPLKLYEYQAVGRPVVSTPVAGFRDAAGVIIAGRDQFADAVATSIPSPSTFPEGARRSDVDWSTRVEQFHAALP